MGKRTVPIPQHTAEMLARVVAKIAPPPKLTLSEWADNYRRLSQGTSAMPGKWRTSKAPYQKEIMDAISDNHVRKVVVMSAAQIGKTDALVLNTIGYYMKYAPAPIMVMQPSLEMGQGFSKERLTPMLHDTPCLRGMVDDRSRMSGNTILQKKFPGGLVVIVGANSPASLASRPIKVLLADEIDRYPASAGKEGDPLSLAAKRQTSYWDKKEVYISTPTIKGQSRIEVEFEHSTQEEFYVPCPNCGHYQPLVWANLHFDVPEPGDISYTCERCGVADEEYRWKAQEIKGKWVAAKPEEKARGFHINTLASTFCGWAEVVEKFKLAKQQLDVGDPEKMKTWVNTELGQTWEERGKTVESDNLLTRREIYDAEVPDGVMMLTAGVDTQDDRFEVEVVGWGKGKESWGIRYQKIYGDMLKQTVWNDLDAFLRRTWQKRDGTRLHLLAVCMDSGGHFPDEVLRFCKERTARRIFAIKGRGGAAVPYTSNPTKNNRVKAPQFTIGVDTGKTILYERLNVQSEGPNYCHFPLNKECGYDEQYFQGLTAEKMVMRYKRGRAVFSWELKDGIKRNEPLDLRNYATAAVEIANPPELAEEEMRQAPAGYRRGRRQISGGI